MIIIPEIMLIISKIPTIFAVSLRFSLCLKSTRIPNPALDKSPAMAEPKLIEPLIKSIVKAIEVAQLGINPKNDVNTGSKNLNFATIVCSAICFEYTSIRKFKPIVIIKINIKIFAVCFKG